jgi:Rrf2 family protein
MMRLERATAYAILALIYLAKCDGGEPQQVHVISKESGVPVEYLRKLMGRMNRARIVSGTRGRSGGFKLARPAAQINMLQVVEAIEGNLDATCIFDADLSGRGAMAKRIERWRQRGATELRAMLEKTAIADIAG